MNRCKRAYYAALVLVIVAVMVGAVLMVTAWYEQVVDRAVVQNQ